ncbi:hypothetical protein [Nonomuraea sp. NPDC050310]|uniref:hypothetical protein n=1 Tax=Nonomuraea sp. NPDC050310 TaxID=3154935 RepID=UPI0033DD0D1B
MTENDPSRLRFMAEHLWELRSGGESLTPMQYEALVEAMFRIAVHPSTPVRAAIDLLFRCQSLDPGNPKFPYHLGLIELRHGRLMEASEFLLLAAERSPTSHRIWAHVAYAQRRLHEEHVGRPGYAGAFRKRAEAIYAAIMEGADVPDPGPDPGGPEPVPHVRTAVPRISGAGECRWSGVYDLDFEDRLQATPNERSRDRLAGSLEEVVRRSLGRPDGAARAAVLGVAWLLRGYPPETLRRVVEPLRLPSAAFQLLSDVIDVYGLPEAEIPERLACLLKAGRLPGLLATLLYRHLLLRSPLEFPDLNTHRVARELLAAARDPHPAEAAQCVSGLLAAVRALAPAPVRAMPEDTPKGETGTAAERLIALEDELRRFWKLHGELLALAKEVAKSSNPKDSQERARLAGDVAALTSAVDLLADGAVRMMAETDELEKADRGDLSPEEFRERRAALKSSLQSPDKNKPNAQLKRARGRLDKTSTLAGGEPTPTDETRKLLTAVRECFAEPPSAKSPEPVERVVAVDSGLPPREQVAAALALADEVMAEVFTRARAAVGDAVELEPLRRYIAGREAETLHRTGQRVQARRAWSVMLRRRPFDQAVLHDLAVAQTVGGDPASAAAAWGACLEALYLKALIADDPREHARERAEIHATLAGAFGTASLLASRDTGEEGYREITTALSGTGRVGAHNAHLRLELLNRRLLGRGDRLRFGISRPDADGELPQETKARLEEEIRIACASLRGGTGERFAELCVRSLSEPSVPLSSQAKEAEDEAHAGIVESLFRSKHRIRNALVSDRTWCVSVYSGDVVASLREIDRIALDPDDAATLAVVQRIDSGRDPADNVKEINDLAELATRVALSTMRTEAQEDDPLFPRRYRGTGESWVRVGLPEKYIKVMDDPDMAHTPAVVQAFTAANTHRQNRDGPDDLDRQTRTLLGHAITALTRWTARLEGASGPPVMKSTLLSMLGDHKAAYATLDTARELAFSPTGRTRIARSLVEVDLDAKNFVSACGRLRDLLAEAETEDLKRLLAVAYNYWIGEGPPGPDPADITRDFGSWTDHRSVRDRRTLVTAATLNRLENAEGIMIANAMERLLAADPDNREAEFHLLASGRVKQLQEARLRERDAVGLERRRHYDARRLIIEQCTAGCTAYLAKEDDPEDPGAARRRRALTDLLTKLRR